MSHRTSPGPSFDKAQDERKLRDGEADMSAKMSPARRTAFLRALAETGNQSFDRLRMIGA